MTEAALRASLVQIQPGADAPANIEACINGIRQAAQDGARLVLLPELHNHRYPCQTQDPQRFDLAEPVPGPTTEALGRLARELEIVVVASIFEQRASGVYHNTAAVLDIDGTLAGVYRKMHIPEDPGYHEKYYFTPGDTGFAPIDTALGRLGVLVCYDQWFPEAARLMALNGAQILLYPTAIGWEPDDPEAEQQRQLNAWQTVQRSHAIVNALPLLCCNRWGFEPSPDKRGGAHFWGSSFICGPQGEILEQAPADKSATLTADLSLGRTEELRRVWTFLRDRRIDAYQALSERHGH